MDKSPANVTRHLFPFLRPLTSWMSMPRAKGIVGVRWEESTPRAESPTVAEAVLLKRRQASSWNQLAAWRCFAHPFVSNLPVKAALPLFPFSPHTQRNVAWRPGRGRSFRSQSHHLSDTHSHSLHISVSTSHTDKNGSIRQLFKCTACGTPFSSRLLYCWMQPTKLTESILNQYFKITCSFQNLHDQVHPRMSQ